MTKIEGYVRFRKNTNRYEIKKGGKFENYARYLYEKTYGLQPKDYIMVYIDGNPRNIELDNLYMVSRRQSVYIRVNKLGYKTKEELKALCLLSDLATKIPHYVRPSRIKATL